MLGKFPRHLLVAFGLGDAPVHLSYPGAADLARVCVRLGKDFGICTDRIFTRQTAASAVVTSHRAKLFAPINGRELSGGENSGKGLCNRDHQRRFSRTVAGSGYRNHSHGPILPDLPLRRGEIQSQVAGDSNELVVGTSSQRVSVLDMQSDEDPLSPFRSTTSLCYQ